MWQFELKCRSSFWYLFSQGNLININEIKIGYFVGRLCLCCFIFILATPSHSPCCTPTISAPSSTHPFCPSDISSPCFSPQVAPGLSRPVARASSVPLMFPPVPPRAPVGPLLAFGTHRPLPAPGPAPPAPGPAPPAPAPIHPAPSALPVPPQINNGKCFRNTAVKISF